MLGLSASADGRAVLAGGRIVDELRRLLGSLSGGLAGQATKALVNLCDDAELLGQMPALVPTLMELLRDDDCDFKRVVVMLLSNLSQSTEACERLLQLGGGGGGGGGAPMGLYFRLLIQWFLAPVTADDPFEFVAPLLQNLTQVPAARRILLEPERGILPPLLRQLGAASVVRRRGVAAVVRNLCFETGDAEVRYLLSPAVDSTTALLLPLAGPDRYCAEEKEGMPPALYAGSGQQREADPATRRHVVEALVLLAATRPARDRLRSSRCVSGRPCSHCSRGDRAMEMKCFAATPSPTPIACPPSPPQSLSCRAGLSRVARGARGGA